MRSPVAELAKTYPQLYLDPDRCGMEDYKAIVLRGGRSDGEEVLQHQRRTVLKRFR